MLRYDHSKKILDGLFMSHLQTDSLGRPIYDEQGELSYRQTSISFPTPGVGPSGTYQFTKGYTLDSIEVFETTSFLASSFDLYQEGQMFSVEFQGTEFQVKPFYIPEEKTLLLGNGRLIENVTTLYPSWSGFDKTLRFAVVIKNFGVSGEDDLLGHKPSVTIYALYEEAGKYFVSIKQHPEVMIYIGLFTTLPNHYGTEYKEPGREVEGIYKNWKEYLRPRLNTKSRFDKKINLIGKAKINSDGYAEINNQDMILFPESVGDPSEDLSDMEAGWGHIEGFGLFYESEPYKNVLENTSQFIPEEQNEAYIYSCENILKDNVFNKQQYILSWSQKTSSTEPVTNEYRGKYIQLEDGLYMGNISLLGKTAVGYESTEPYVGRITNSILTLYVPESNFTETRNDSSIIQNVSVDIKLTNEGVPFLWGTIQGKDENGDPTEGVDIERYQVPVIRKTGLSFTLK